MSADAKAWREHDRWYGCHDGDCIEGISHSNGVHSLTTLLREIEQCMGYELAWAFREYPESIGLVGYVFGGGRLSEEQVST
jgi:hypothetical protein